MTQRAEVSDVTVVGAGPVGLLLALELRRHGARPRVVERADAPTSHSKACVIWPRGAELLRAAGVLNTLAAEAEPLHGIRIEAYGRRLGRLEVGPGADARTPNGMLVGQDRTERVLGDALAAAGIPIERGREVTGVRQDDDEVSIDLAGGETLRSRYVAGCDGAASVVRKALGVAYEGETYADHKLMQAETGMRASFPRVAGEARFWLYDDGFLGYLPMPGGRARLFALVPDSDPSDDRTPTLEEMRELVADIARDPKVELFEPGWLSHARFQHRRAASFEVGRCFLAGDAARIVPPILGQGMNTGMQDAANLASKLAWVLRGRAPRSLLSAYAAEREQIADLVIRRTDTAYRHLSDPSRLQRLAARAAGRVLVERERVQQAARDALTGLAYRYERSPAIDPRGEHDALVGSRVPDSPLVDGALRRTSVHELAERDAVTAFVFCARRPELLESARRVAAALGSHEDVLAHVVACWSPDVVGDLLVDYDGLFLDACHADAGDVVVVRPDGHVGHRGSIDDLAPTTAYLATLAGSRVLTGVA